MFLGSGTGGIHGIVAGIGRPARCTVAGSMPDTESPTCCIRGSGEGWNAGSREVQSTVAGGIELGGGHTWDWTDRTEVSHRSPHQSMCGPGMAWARGATDGLGFEDLPYPSWG